MATKAHFPPLRIHCSATGAKLFLPAITDAEACGHFTRVLATARAERVKPRTAVSRDEVTVELRFLKQGVASAAVTRIGPGPAQAPIRLELAVSDRGFRVADIERLARNVAAQLFDTK